jgi:hypothetical protein
MGLGEGQGPVRGDSRLIEKLTLTPALLPGRFELPGV